MRKIDMIGRPFGRLTVIREAPSPKTEKRKRLRYECRCSCGNTCVVAGEDLRSGHTKSCGCLNHRGNVKHHGCGEKLYGVWKTMKSRCTNPKVSGFQNYGGRGISVCAEWANDYSVFRDWAFSTGYKPGLTIDRIDCSKGYDPENCRWASRTTQSRNQRARSDSTTGIRGVKLTPLGTYVAELYVGDRRISLGEFDNLADATTARQNAERYYWGGDANAI